MDNNFESSPLTSDAKTETKIPISINKMGKRAFFSISNAIKSKGIEIEINKI
jgi:hypothetical protein